MPAFITLDDSNFNDPSFWASQNVDANSTIDATGLNNNIQITMAGTSITFTNTQAGTSSTYTDSDLLSGSFSNFVEFSGNDADNDVSGSIGLNASGYTGGAGNDTFVDDGSLGGGMSGGDGNDTLVGGDGANEMYGGGGNDVLSGSGGNNNIYGGAGNDTLYADGGSGNLIGGAGDDVVYAGLNTTYANGDSGNNTLFVPEGTVLDEYSSGSGTANMPNGNSFYYTNFQTVAVVCFTRGTQIATAREEVAIEDLNVGDMVKTMDNGYRPIRWIGNRKLDQIDLLHQPKLRPVRIRAGALGSNIPEHDLIVSPQHRVLARSLIAQRMFNTMEVLIPSIHLCILDGIDQVEGLTEVEYWHMLFDDHEIIFSNGAATESLLTGPEALKGLSPEARDEIFAIFPEVGAPDYTPPTARHIPDKGISMKKFAARHGKNSKPLFV
jgi:hypothetical protein